MAEPDLALLLEAIPLATMPLVMEKLVPPGSVLMPIGGCRGRGCD